MIKQYNMPIYLRAVALIFFIAAAASSWGANRYSWEESADCRWQTQQTRQAMPWQWIAMRADTIRPEFPTHACDLICPDFQTNWLVVNATCGESDGKITVHPQGYPAGTTFTYNWSGGVSNSNVAENLPAGLYTVSISVAQSGNGDFRNCDIVVRIPVSENGGPQVSATVKGADCITEAGLVKLTISSGTPPFTISRDGGPAQTLNNLGTSQFGGLPAGSYRFYHHGCQRLQDLQTG
jgi:hypothetical protein